MNINKLMQHAASPSNPPKGYGSISKGLEVAAYRSKLWDKHHTRLGVVELHQLIDREVVKKFGKPF